ncbi:MAG TPA: peptidase S58 family protein [Desulfobacteraceae bacterium]|nr:peptidase S58 family protein [Desulfobacteraceae bacterium]
MAELKGIRGVYIGHAHDNEIITGVTVILCPGGFSAGIDIRGSATSTRQIDSLSTNHLISKIHAVCLSGGSAYGLGAGSGVMKFLKDKRYGFGMKELPVPIVPTGVIFDLAIGKREICDYETLGHEACIDAMDGRRIAEGSVGAGMGATVGKFFGIEYAMKGGMGISKRSLNDGLYVYAIAVVNCFGDVVDPDTKRIIAGARKTKSGKRFANTYRLYLRGKKRAIPPFSHTNTTLGAIITNAKLDKQQATLVSRMAQAAVVKTISPAHTIYDGDMIFTIASGEIETDPHIVGVLGEEALKAAILRAINKAASIGNIPSVRSL